MTIELKTYLVIQEQDLSRVPHPSTFHDPKHSSVGMLEPRRDGRPISHHSEPSSLRNEPVHLYDRNGQPLFIIPQNYFPVRV